jgi:hypothetical protein
LTAHDQSGNTLALHKACFRFPDSLNGVNLRVQQ